MDQLIRGPGFMPPPQARPPMALNLTDHSPNSSNKVRKQIDYYFSNSDEDSKAPFPGFEWIIYHGTPLDGQEVVVKVGSATSTRGTREFENEEGNRAADLLAGYARNLEIGPHDFSQIFIGLSTILADDYMNSSNCHDSIAKASNYGIGNSAVPRSKGFKSHEGLSDGANQLTVQEKGVSFAVIASTSSVDHMNSSWFTVVGRVGAGNGGRHGW
ncbi:hypothetical protein Sjap_016830 [Stephania japonica]|uniref:Uncharacterized protein n=1 Tax=Stephania japonica TaxID=461633 RepID=A0AAP0I504_9MAGN